MSATVVWMDHEQAKLFHLKPGAPAQVQPLTHRKQDHHTHAHRDDKHSSEFFHQLIDALQGSSEILLMGPGTAKSEFRHHLEKHGHGAIAKKVVGVETVDHPTENQVLAVARKFFKSKDLFEDPIR